MIFQLLLCIAIGLRCCLAGPAEEPKCGEELPGEAGSFQSPGYPIIYPDKLNCTWTIKRPAKPSILKFVGFEVEMPLFGGGCEFDYVLVTVGSGASASTHGPLCGYQPPEDIHYNDEVTVKFISDRIRAYKGFAAVYYPEDATETPSTPVPETTTTGIEENITRTPYPCGGNLKGPSGNISSPEYPNNYPNDLGCSWTIEQPSKPGVLKFETFDVERVNWGEHCQFDYLYVFVGTGRNVISHGPFCGDELPNPIEYNDTVQVTFTTDRNVTHRGFLIEFGPKG
ncbi:hypothetical protein CRM22_000060 [Opisthorchis felineus]|uniref:CUB domain-containing protein n=2 Tax=Opisthorchis felineus TaxID=147828 RepID=A0A4S2MH49_OPIFE|nr:hypothetical protein CRM22_000060 [Opisthorchis felineus]